MATNVLPYDPNAPSPSHYLRVRLQMFAEDTALPTATTEATLTPVVMADRTQGSLEIVLQARAAVTVVAGTSVTFRRASTDTSTVPFSKVALAVNAGTYKAGDVIGILPLPTDSPEFIQAKWTGAAGNTGKVDLFLSFVPR